MSLVSKLLHFTLFVSSSVLDMYIMHWKRFRDIVFYLSVLFVLFLSGTHVEVVCWNKAQDQEGYTRCIWRRAGAEKSEAVRLDWEPRVWTD